MLTENQIVEAVTRWRSPEDQAAALQPDSTIRAAIRGKLHPDCLTFDERKAAAIGRVQRRRGHPA